MTDTLSDHADSGLEKGQTLIEMTDVGKSYGAIRALRGINLRVNAGEVTCVLGDNGAGKSTLIKIMSGLHGHNEGTLQAGSGVGNEFLYIIAAVVGGTLLTGGFGNAIGVAIGAFIFGMTSLGIIYAGWDPNWFKAFLGVMLLLAVLVNLYVKRMSTMRKVG